MVALPALLLGLMLGHFLLALILVLVAYLYYYLKKLSDLESWLEDSTRFEPPEARGAWGEVFNHILLLQQRNRKQKRTLASALTQFQKAATALPDGIVILEADASIEWCNQAARRLLGLRVPQDVGYPITNFLRSPALSNYIKKGEFDEPLDMISPLNSDMHLAIRLVPYGNDQRLLVARDMSRIMRLEQTRKVFVANVSHELRTPLTVISGYVENLVNSDDEGTARWRRQFAAMQQQTQRMSRIVDELLMLSQLETKTLPVLEKPVDVPSLVRNLVNEATMLSGDNKHQLQADIDNGLWLRASSSEIQSAFQNLMSNAVRYTPAGGKISLRWYLRAGVPCFEVQDSGIGIEARHIPLLTERFYRVDEARSRATGGTGLGLSIVKQILTRHGGNLQIDSVPGTGSTFRCEFPLDLLVRQQ